jgi:predicted RNA binding protein YcfA (HicA-like mRNA interferase family)
VVNASKIHRRLMSDPSQIIAFRDFEHLLSACGFKHVRTTRSHRHYVHPAVPQVLTVQPDRKDAKRYQVRRLLDIIAEYNLSIEA